MAQILEQLKQQAAKLARDSAISAALLRASVRGQGLAIRTFLEAEDRINVSFDANDQPVVTCRDSSGKFVSIDAMLKTMKSDPEWAANFQDATTTVGGADMNTGKPRTIKASEINTALRDGTITLQDLAKGPAKHGGVDVEFPGEEPAGLAANEVSADSLTAGNIPLADIASGKVAVRFGS